MGSVPNVFSGTHLGGDDGTVSLGDGETATVSNSDGVTFDWSSTIPIDVLIVRGSPVWANAFFQTPPATSGARLSPPKNPDDQDRQLPLTSVKFCFLDRSGPPQETPASNEARACTHETDERRHSYSRTDAIIGRVGADDPVKLGQFSPTNNVARCTSPFDPPVLEDTTTPFHYDAWRFENSTGAEACVSVSVLTDAGTRPFQVQLFHDAVEPLSENYLAHANNCRVCNLSVRVPADGVLVVALSGAPQGSADAETGAGYRLDVGGCGTNGGNDGGVDGDSDAGDHSGDSGKTW